MCEPRILCVTNRALCREDFFTRLERIAAARPAAILLREKDLPEGDYLALAQRALAICQAHATPCILHSFPDVAEQLGAPLHLPLPLLRALSPARRARFRALGASCHSVQEALEAQSLGCTYITAGHVFATDCKKGLAPRGLAFLEAVCQSVGIPVWAIGGIAPENFPAVLSAGAAGGCVMSGLMACADPAAVLAEFARRAGTAAGRL